MPIWECNAHFKKLKSMSSYLLHQTKVIIHYNIDQTIEDIVLKPHRNSKSKETFRPTMHTVKEDCKAKVQNDSRPARHIIDDFENAENFFQRETYSVVARNPRQIYNFQQNVLKNKTKDDDVLDIIVEMLNQAKDSCSFRFPIDLNQPFIREFLYQSGEQPIFVLFLDQNFNNIKNRFCTDICPSPFDTTFNIGEFKFTQATYKNLSLYKKGTAFHPWFPGPILVHRTERKIDFELFWHSVKRYKKELGAVKLIGSDDCEELYEGILSQTSNTIQLFGVEHVMKNIEDFLRDSSLPLNVHCSFIEYVVGKSGLVSCRSDSEFDEMLQNLIKKWADIEKEYINDQKSKFSDYFIKNKAEKIKSKLTKSVRDKINFAGDYYQNCIEWSHYMTKPETDLGLKDSHKGAALVNAFMRVKNRNLRMYRDASKSLYL